MYEFLKQKKENRAALIQDVASQMRLHPSIVEKDFWVCLVLDFLFHKCSYASQMRFKGGTSLSKAYSLIERFSEDIDLVLDWRALGYSKTEPWDDQGSKNKQDRFNKKIDERTDKFIAGNFLTEIKTGLSEAMGDIADVRAIIGRQTLEFHYPQLFHVQNILPCIRLEIGPLAEWTPWEERKITPYAEEFYPDKFSLAATKVKTIMAKRTFWEKITILHKEANRPADKPVPTRQSRHFYDVFCMAGKQVKNEALADVGVLMEKVKFTKKFYPQPWSRFEDIEEGNIKLTPPVHSFASLRKDYANMSEMFFGNYPDFDEILECLKTLEPEVNEAVKRYLNDRS